MILSKPIYNIVTPLNMVEIITDHLDSFLKECEDLLEIVTVASIRIRTGSLTDTQLIKVFECLLKVNTRQIPILIENNLELAGKLKVDGIHLTTGQKLVKEARETLGKNKIIGAFCGSSKHSGLVAAEHGANYVSFQTENDPLKGDESNHELLNGGQSLLKFQLWLNVFLKMKSPKKY